MDPRLLELLVCPVTKGPLDYDRELTELTSLCESGAQHMTELEATLRARADIPTLKVRFTRVFGWYIANRTPSSPSATGMSGE